MTFKEKVINKLTSPKLDINADLKNEAEVWYIISHIKEFQEL